MRKKLLFFLNFTSIFLFSQQQLFPQWYKQWQNGTLDFQEKFYEIDKLGNHVISGTLDGTVDFDPSSNVYNLNTTGGNYGGAIMKLDSNGNFLWAKKFVTSDHLEIKSMSIDMNGNVYLVIQYQPMFTGIIDIDPGAGTVNVSISTPGNILVSLSKNGSYRWHDHLTSNTLSKTINHLKIDRHNRIFIYGSCFGTVDIDPGIGVVNIPSGNYFARYDTLGNYLWSKNVGGNSTLPGVRNLNFDYDNNVIITTAYDNSTMTDFDYGPSTVTLSALTSTAYAYNEAVIKTDSLMNFVWVNAFHFENLSLITKILIDSSNNVFVCGDTGNGKIYPKYNDTSYHRGPVIPSLINWSPFIIKYNGVNGSYLNDLYVSRPHPYDFDIAKDGKLYITGLLAGTADFDQNANVFNLTCGVAGDAFIAIYDSNFNFNVAYKYTNFPSIPDDVQFGYFVRPSYNSIYFYLMQNGNVDYGAASSPYVPYIVNTNYSKTLIKFSTSVVTNTSIATGIENLSDNYFSVYPNPFSTNVILNNNNSLKNASLTICNSVGQVVKQMSNVIYYPVTIYRDNLPNGIYFIQIKQDNKVTYVKKIIITDN